MKTEAIYRVNFSTQGRVTIPVSYGIKREVRMAFEVTQSGASQLRPVDVT